MSSRESSTPRRRILETACVTLGDESFDRLWAQAAQTPLQQVIAEMVATIWGKSTEP